MEEEEEESSRPCVECEVPRELLLHGSKLISPPVFGFERFVENKYSSIKRRRIIVQCKEEDFLIYNLIMTFNMQLNRALSNSIPSEIIKTNFS